MAESYDVIVVGGGPVGAAAARELSLAGRRILVLEPGGDTGQGWRAAAGMLAPQIEAQPDDPMLELGLAGRELYSTLAPALREATGIDIGLWREGIAHVAATETESAELRARCAWQRQSEPPGFSSWAASRARRCRRTPRNMCHFRASE